MGAADFSGPLQEGGIGKMFNHVIWPEQYDPRHSAIYALNDIDVKAPPESGLEVARRCQELVESFSP